MKETARRGGADNKGKSRPARTDTRNRRTQEKNASKNMEAKVIDAKCSSDKPNTNTLVSDLKTGGQIPEVHETVVVDHVDCAHRSEEVLLDSKARKMDEEHEIGNFNDSSVDMDIAVESDDGTTYDSVSSQGDSYAAEEDKAEDVARVPKRVENSHSDDKSHASGSKFESQTNCLKIKASNSRPRKGAKPEKGNSKSNTRSSFDNLKNMKVHPKPLSESSGVVSQPLEQDEGTDVLEDSSNGHHSVCNADGVISAQNSDKQEHQAAIDQKIEEMETRIRNLEGELREVATLEIALYSVVPEHGSSAHKVHTPARRLSRLYIYACKHCSQDRRATVARNTVSGLVLVSKSCGNDVSRLTFWLSNTVVLRELISQSFGSSCNSISLMEVFESNGGEPKPSHHNGKKSIDNTMLNKQGLIQFVEDWQETRTFTSALEKVELWIFSRIVESIWWQTLAPNMQSHVADSAANQGIENLLSPALGDQKHSNFSIKLWENAFLDSLKRLCPVRAGGHECGCLPVLARKVMEQCVSRLDVAMFNAILRESANEIPTDPLSDPIVDSKVLPIPAGDLSFGSGAQLKKAVGNWVQWLSDFLGMDADDHTQDDCKRSNKNEGNLSGKEPKNFPLLSSLSDLLIIPKEMVMDCTVRMEVCSSISLPLVKRILCNFSPDEFCPDPVPGAVLEALNAECIVEQRVSGDSDCQCFPHTAPPVVYTLPSSSEVTDGTGVNSGLSRSASVVQRKGYTSDEELDELQSCLSTVTNPSPLSPLVENGNRNDVGNARYDLLRQVWKAS